MLETDLHYAVEFFVKNDPLDLVGNLDNRFWLIKFNQLSY